MTSSTAGWASTSHPKEIERLTHLLWHYETVNLEQKNQLDTMVTSRDNLISRIQQHESEKKKQAKQLRSLELQLKYEKAATEGLRKKTGLLEKELIDLKEVLEKAQNHENDLGERKTTIEQELKEERAYRLQLIHEKEKLQEEVNRLSALLQKVEQQNVDASQKVLDLQQLLETAQARSTRQEKLIKVQSDDIVSLNAELLRLKERFMGKTRDLLEEQRNHADYHLTMDKMQEEISFLRKELSIHSKSISDTNIASSVNLRKSKRQNGTTKFVNAKTAKRYNVSHFRDDGTFSNRHMDSMVSNSLAESVSSKANLQLENGEEGSQRSRRRRQKRIPRDDTDDDDGEIMTPFSPAKSWISDTFPQNTWQSTFSGHGLGEISSATPSSRAGTASRNGKVPALQLSPLATRDRPRDSLDHAQPNIDVDNETQAYFNNPERVALLQWIRTASRQASRQRSASPDGRPSNTSGATAAKYPVQQQHHRVNELQQIYQPSSSTLSSSSPALHKVNTAPPTSLQAFSQELKPFTSTAPTRRRTGH